MAPPLHHCHVFATPWPGIHGTHIDSGRHFGRHWHDTFGLGLLEHGAQSSASGRGPVDAFAGDLITTNPGEVHDGQPLGSPSRRWRMVYLEPDAMAALAGAGRLPALTRPVIHDDRLAQSLQALFRRLDHWSTQPAHDGALALACEEALAGTLGHLLAAYSTDAPAPPAPAPLAQVRERLADDATHAPSLAELAAMAGLSRFQLLRRFEKAYGLPPHAWLLQQRAERARHLIRRGLPLAEAAAAAGFADQSHMTRVFTRQFGFTPGAWRQAAGARRP
ncbi:AraC family transcriptional regulator [Eleftheria terrae]|uniref:AraC family transcriptional regulator n=1 Tax=Eleftheria terrae TaxID=1597781 RepID=UPI00263BCD93|nr:AraC family transcriptional regulator [Eleftheria terrae]WKB51791.1 AraC family transcriptional regulator [Eleftheria terrae]